VTGPGRSGYEAGTRAPERRAFFDLSKRIAALEEGGGGGTGGAGDEIWVGPDDPAKANYEMWYDTDAIPALDATKLPRGFVGQDYTGTAVTGIGSALTYLGARVDFTADPTRRYKTTLITGRIDQMSAAANAFAGIYDAATPTPTPIRYNYLYLPAGVFGFITVFAVEWGLTGAIARRAMGSTSAGTVNFQAWTTVLVEDIGGV
jgi:hypothetical protein